MKRLSAFAAALAIVAGPVAAQPFTGDQHGDWAVRCVETAGPCAITQHVIAGNREGIDLEVLAWRVGDEGPMLQVRVPLGAWLRAGIEVRVDEQAIGRMNFERCAADGCFAEVLLDERLLGLMRTGTTALFVFRLYDDPDAGIGVPISLTGFAPGFDALAPGP